MKKRKERLTVKQEDAIVDVSGRFARLESLLIDGELTDKKVHRELDTIANLIQEAFGVWVPVKEESEEHDVVMYEHT